MHTKHRPAAYPHTAAIDYHAQQHPFTATTQSDYAQRHSEHGMREDSRAPRGSDAYGPHYASRGAPPPRPDQRHHEYSARTPYGCAGYAPPYGYAPYHKYPGYMGFAQRTATEQPPTAHGYAAQCHGGPYPAPGQPQPHSFPEHAAYGQQGAFALYDTSAAGGAVRTASGRHLESSAGEAKGDGADARMLSHALFSPKRLGGHFVQSGERAGLPHTAGPEHGQPWGKQPQMVRRFPPMYTPYGVAAARNASLFAHSPVEPHSVEVPFGFAEPPVRVPENFGPPFEALGMHGPQRAFGHPPAFAEDFARAVVVVAPDDLLAPLEKSVLDLVATHLDAIMHWTVSFACDAACTRATRAITLEDVCAAWNLLMNSPGKALNTSAPCASHTNILEMIENDAIERDVT